MWLPRVIFKQSNVLGTLRQIWPNFCFIELGQKKEDLVLRIKFLGLAFYSLLYLTRDFPAGFGAVRVRPTAQEESAFSYSFVLFFNRMCARRDTVFVFPYCKAFV